MSTTASRCQLRLQKIFRVMLHVVTKGQVRIVSGSTLEKHVFISAFHQNDRRFPLSLELFLHQKILENSNAKRSVHVKACFPCGLSSPTPQLSPYYCPHKELVNFCYNLLHAHLENSVLCCMLVPTVNGI